MSANRRHRRGRVESTESVQRRAWGIRRNTNLKWDAVVRRCVGYRRGAHHTLNVWNGVDFGEGLFDFPAHASQTTTIGADWVKRNHRQMLGQYARAAALYPTTLGPGVDGDLPAFDEDF